MDLCFQANVVRVIYILIIQSPSRDLEHLVTLIVSGVSGMAEKKRKVRASKSGEYILFIYDTDGQLP